MKHIHLFETPRRFDEPEATPAGEYPAHMPVALLFGKFIDRMGDRVHATRTPDHVRFSISNEPYKVDKSDIELIRAMNQWQEYDKIHPLNVRYLVHPGELWSYVRYVINREWPEAEPYIMKDPEYAYMYARHLRDREWPEAEPYIMTNANRASSYAMHVRKRRWPEAEPCIRNNSYFWNEYKKHFKIP